jgi:hypothetical protein
MPEILELLKRERSLDTRAIVSHARVLAGRKGLTFRQEAIGFSLTALKRQGWAANPKRGRWSITESGTRVTLRTEQVDKIGRDLWDG